MSRFEIDYQSAEKIMIDVLKEQIETLHNNIKTELDIIIESKKYTEVQLVNLFDMIIDADKLNKVIEYNSTFDDFRYKYPLVEN